MFPIEKIRDILNPLGKTSLVNDRYRYSTFRSYVWRVGSSGAALAVAARSLADDSDPLARRAGRFGSFLDGCVDGGCGRVAKDQLNGRDYTTIGRRFAVIFGVGDSRLVILLFGLQPHLSSFLLYASSPNGVFRRAHVPGMWNGYNQRIHAYQP